jgi:uncharacterized protein YegL
MIIVHSKSAPAPKTHNTVALSHPMQIGMVLDASGSMGNYADSIIVGFNTILEEQATLSNHTRVSLTLFNSTVRQVYSGSEIVATPPLDASSYKCSGGTALYDGIMTAIDKVGETVGETVDTNQAGAGVVIAILSDGIENASQHHTLPAVRSMITYRQTQGWKFLYIGPKAATTAHQLGIPVGNAVSLTASGDGIRQALGQLNSALQNIRLGNTEDVFRLR